MLGRFCTDLAALGPYCHNLGPIFPSTALALGYGSKRLIFSISPLQFLDKKFKMLHEKKKRKEEGCI